MNTKRNRGSGRGLGKWACICLLLPMLFSACHQEEPAADANLQRLCRLEIYAADGELLRMLEDTDSLSTWNSFGNAALAPEDDATQAEYEKLTQSLPILCTIRSYKTAAAIGKEDSLEDYITQTVYADTNIIKEEISPEMIKNMPVAPEALTFYVMLSEEEKQTLLSFAEEKEEF